MCNFVALFLCSLYAAFAIFTICDNTMLLVGQCNSDFVQKEAKKRGCPAVLDTDSDKKALKYEHCGMNRISQKDMGHGVTLYTLEYR